MFPAEGTECAHMRNAGSSVQLREREGGRGRPHATDTKARAGACPTGQCSRRAESRSLGRAQRRKDGVPARPGQGRIQHLGSLQDATARGRYTPHDSVWDMERQSPLPTPLQLAQGWRSLEGLPG